MSSIKKKERRNRVKLFLEDLNSIYKKTQDLSCISIQSLRRKHKTTAPKIASIPYFIGKPIDDNLIDQFIKACNGNIDLYTEPDEDEDEYFSWDGMSGMLGATETSIISHIDQRISQIYNKINSFEEGQKIILLDTNAMLTRIIKELGINYQSPVALNKQIP